MKVIVTGAAGFIGSAVIWALNQAGEDGILAVDHLGTSEKWRNLCPLRFADYMEKEDFRRMLAEGRCPDAKAIIHMGACSSTTERDATYLADNNYNYTKELALFAASKGIRFIYASSAATYGDGSQGYHDDQTKLDSLRPLNMYGYSKHLFDLWARRNGLLSKIAGLKFTNVFGPNEQHKNDMRSVVCRAFEQIRDTGKVRLFKSCRPDYKDGEQKRDFLYVKDAVSMALFLLNERPDATGLFNIGSGRAETWNSLATAVFNAMRIEPRIDYIDMPESLRDKYQYYTKAEMGKLFGAGYAKPVTSLSDAVSDYVRNYLVPSKRLGD